MAVDRDRQQEFEYPSTIEQYSTLEPVEAQPAPVDRMQLDPPPYVGPTMADGSPDLAYKLRKILFGGSLSIYAVEAPNGERVRDLSCHWHDDMRATIEAQILRRRQTQTSLSKCSYSGNFSRAPQPRTHLLAMPYRWPALHEIHAREYWFEIFAPDAESFAAIPGPYRRF